VSGAASYTWSNGAVTANPLVNPIVTTGYSVTGSFAACTGTASVVLAVSMIPTITIVSSTNVVCSGNSVSISATGATNYTWNPGLTVAPAITVSPGSTTTFTVRGQHPGCPARTASITITVLQNPTVTITSSSPVACVGETVTLDANGANSYLWSNGSTTNLILITPSLSTNYTVSGMAVNNCKASATITQVMSDCTGISEQVNEVFRVFPNPVYGFFNLSAREETEVSILNEQGALIRWLVLNKNNNYNVCISDLNEGLYVLLARTQRRVVTRKVIVAR